MRPRAGAGRARAGAEPPGSDQASGLVGFAMQGLGAGSARRCGGERRPGRGADRFGAALRVGVRTGGRPQSSEPGMPPLS